MGPRRLTCVLGLLAISFPPAPARSQAAFEPALRDGRERILFETRVAHAGLRETSPFPAGVCLRRPECRQTFVVAHRTAGFGAPEDSRAGVLAAVQAGISFIEADVRLSRDGAFYILHDETLDRTTSMKGPIAAKDSTELAGARLSNGEGLPRMEDLYSTSRGRAILFLDMKVDAVERVAEWIAGNGSFDDVVFFVSDEPAMRSAARAKLRYPRMLVMARVHGSLDLERAEAALGGLPAIVHPDFPSYELVESLHARGAKVYAAFDGTDRVPVFRDMVAEVLLKRKVDFIDTDYPAWLRDFLSR